MKIWALVERIGGVDFLVCDGRGRLLATDNEGVAAVLFGPLIDMLAPRRRLVIVELQPRHP